MSTIKYRQWTGDRFYYWGFGVQDDGAHFTGPVSGGNLRVADQIHEQSTGLADVNGVEIYEGDVVVWLVNDTGFAGEVYFEMGCFDLKTALGNPVCWDPYRGTPEVIGNIHQNPELLTSQPTQTQREEGE